MTNAVTKPETHQDVLLPESHPALGQPQGSEPEKQTLSSFLQNLAGLHPPSGTDLMERENESSGRAHSCVPGCLERFLLLDQRLHHELELMI